MQANRSGVYSFLAVHLAAAALAAGCTGDKNGQPHQVVVQQKAQAAECGKAQLSRFDSTARGERVEPTRLPQGLYLYAGAEMKVEGREGKQAPAIVVAETPANSEFQSHVECVSRVEGEALNVSLNGLTKIELKESGESQVTVRQFQVFINESNHGIVALNPRLFSQSVDTFGDFLESAARSGTVKFFRKDATHFVMQVERESNGQRSRLNISYDYVSAK